MKLRDFQAIFAGLLTELVGGCKSFAEKVFVGVNNPYFCCSLRIFFGYEHCGVFLPSSPMQIDNTITHLSPRTEPVARHAEKPKSFGL